jgi:hypothetical protein
VLLSPAADKPIPFRDSAIARSRLLRGRRRYGAAPKLALWERKSARFIESAMNLSWSDLNKVQEAGDYPFRDGTITVTFAEVVI